MSEFDPTLRPKTLVTRKGEDLQKYACIHIGFYGRNQKRIF